MNLLAQISSCAFLECTNQISKCKYQKSLTKNVNAKITKKASVLHTHESDVKQKQL